MTRRGEGQPIDWHAVRESLDRARAATEAALTPPPDRARAVMDERARTLARPSATPPTGEILELFTFALGRERYALEARYVREILRLVDITPVPGTPEFVLGIVNVRGEIVAVVELGRLFGLRARGVTDLSRLIVLGHERAEFGILADSADEIATIQAVEILEATSAATGIGRELLRGVTRHALIVLDAAALLRDGRLFVGEDRGDIA